MCACCVGLSGRESNVDVASASGKVGGIVYRKFVAVSSYIWTWGHSLNVLLPGNPRDDLETSSDTHIP